MILKLFFALSLCCCFSLLGEIRTLTILHTTDMHAQVESSKRGGGWLKAATVIKRERIKSPTSTLLIDCGDSIQGSFAGRATQGKIAIDIMNHLNYDVWVPGNHEFDFGFKRLLQLSKTSTTTILVANILTTTNKPVF